MTMNFFTVLYDVKICQKSYQILKCPVYHLMFHYKVNILII